MCFLCHPSFYCFCSFPPPPAVLCPLMFPILASSLLPFLSTCLLFSDAGHHSLSPSVSIYVCLSPPGAHTHTHMQSSPLFPYLCLCCTFTCTHSFVLSLVVSLTQTFMHTFHFSLSLSSPLLPPPRSFYLTHTLIVKPLVQMLCSVTPPFSMQSCQRPREPSRMYQLCQTLHPHNSSLWTQQQPHKHSRRTVCWPTLSGMLLANGSG